METDNLASRLLPEKIPQFTDLADQIVANLQQTIQEKDPFFSVSKSPPDQWHDLIH